MLIEKVTIGCFSIEAFRLHGLLNNSTTHCSFMFEKKNNGNYNQKPKKKVYSLRELPLYLHYLAQTVQCCLIYHAYRTRVSFIKSAQCMRLSVDLVALHPKQKIVIVNLFM